MVTIFFETHATSFDNENGVASGWFDTRLSPAGMEQAKQLSGRYIDQRIDTIFTSDLKRAYQTATIAFDFDPKLVFSDWRLREVNYGDLTQSSKQQIESGRTGYLTMPYQNGESYQQAMERMASFIADLKAMYDGKSVLVIGHRATYYGLEHFINNKPLEQLLNDSWQWQPGWKYELQ